MSTQDYALVAVTIPELAQLIQKTIDEGISDTGLTRLSWSASTHLAEAEGLSISELAKALRVGNATTGRLVDRMVDAGWLNRHYSKTDRRAQLITVTAKARDALRQLEPRRRELQEAILADLSREERELLSG
ncbi:MAG: MarR family transcriptional regulator, partial [Alphaproteobacteria bacterium]